MSSWTTCQIYIYTVAHWIRTVTTIVLPVMTSVIRKVILSQCSFWFLDTTAASMSLPCTVSTDWVLQVNCYGFCVLSLWCFIKALITFEELEILSFLVFIYFLLKWNSTFKYGKGECNADDILTTALFLEWLLACVRLTVCWQSFQTLLNFFLLFD